ncbi:MAG: MBL fold metallo-hydrolase [Rhabdochlamydiaceae bacterium]|nr:MBL fold metallo-hydrolase [Candidatus Amphrikana amoebophyrae]
MKIYPINTGHCIGAANIALAGWKKKKMRFLARAFLISSEKYGNILFDSGYGPAYKEHVPPFYDWLLPPNISPDQNVTKGLAEHGFSLLDIDYIFISHFHVDHISGLKDLPNIPWIYRADALQNLLSMNKLKAYKHGFIKELLPSIPEGSIAISSGDFNSPFHNSELKCAPNLDPQLLIVDLPGHALGQMGLCIEDTFFVADAAWSYESLHHNILPSKLGLFLQHDNHAYINTFEQLQVVLQANNIDCIPTHTMEPL